MRIIPITSKTGTVNFALVDSEDYATLSRTRWYVNQDGYAFDRFQNRMHRQVMQAPLGFKVDHKNGNRLDNRRSNLRLVTDAQNVWNSKPRNGIQYKGVTRAGGGMYRATFNGKSIGKFPSREAAATAYNAAAQEKYGEFARLNEVAA
jgi:hypothetical protein